MKWFKKQLKQHFTPLPETDYDGNDLWKMSEFREICLNEPGKIIMFKNEHDLQLYLESDRRLFNEMP